MDIIWIEIETEIAIHILKMISSKSYAARLSNELRKRIWIS
jgi:hypothetical protein